MDSVYKIIPNNQEAVLTPDACIQLLGNNSWIAHRYLNLSLSPSQLPWVILHLLITFLTRLQTSEVQSFCLCIYQALYTAMLKV